MTLTDRELDVLSAWWNTSSVKGAAALLGMSEQTAKNHLYMARMRSGVASNLELGKLHMRALRPIQQLQRSHNTVGREAA